MCIFSQPVLSVTDTNIFARLLPDGWQYLVYQMKYESEQNNAMILPLPVELPAGDEGSLEFISLKDYSHFFTDLAKGFPTAQSKGRSGSLRVDAPANAARPELAVYDVGDFVASFVPSMTDFDRLNKQFRIPQESWDKIPRYADYGFAVFQLKSLKAKPHPMAFKFRSRLNTNDNASIFFPTVHIHDGEVHNRENFDHTLYLQAEAFDRACGEYQLAPRLVTDPKTGYVRSKWAAAEFCDIAASKNILDGDALIHRLEMRGEFENTDMLAKFDLSHVDQQSSYRPLMNPRWLAGSAGLAGLLWLFNRRSALSGK